MNEVSLPRGEQVAIYGLVDPNSGVLRYVGKANCPATRLKQHVATAKRKNSSQKDKWLNSLNALPQIVILGVCSESDWPELETRWIALAKDMGASLTNARPGGEGVRHRDDGAVSLQAKIQVLSERHGEKLANALQLLAANESLELPLPHWVPLFLRCKAGQWGGAPDSAWAVAKWTPVAWYEPCAFLGSPLGQAIPKLPPLRRTCRSLVGPRSYPADGLLKVDL